MIEFIPAPWTVLSTIQQEVYVLTYSWWLGVGWVLGITPNTLLRHLPPPSNNTKGVEMENSFNRKWLPKPAITHCTNGHELAGHTIRMVGFGDEVFTVEYTGRADQWLVYDVDGVEMLGVSVAEMIPYLIEE